MSVGALIKVGAKGLSKVRRGLSKKEQAKKGMGTESKYRVESATRSKKAKGVAAQVRADEQKLKSLKDAKRQTTNSKDKAKLSEQISILTNKINNTKQRYNMKSKGGSMKKYEEGGKVSKPMSKKEAFAKHKKTTGSYHKLDPLHPMNAERTGAPKKMPRAVGLVRKKSGGKVGKCSHNRMY